MTTKIEQALAIVRDSHQPKLAAFLQAGPSQEARETMAEQLLEFETQYPGGLVSYSHKIIKLMDEYVKNITKYDDVKLNTPATISLNWNELDLIRKSDLQGIPEMKKCAFFLLGGGLGERLGYNGAKPCMHIESISGFSFLQLSCEYLLAYQQLFGTKIGLTKLRRRLLFHLLL